MKEIVILSGKGGTGKTSITAAFASLTSNTVFADCDVDAADLHIIFKPKPIYKSTFISGHEAVIQQKQCNKCGICYEYCQFQAVQLNPISKEYHIDSSNCEGCKVCVEFCPQKAIEFPSKNCGEWYISTTRFGPMVHAQLGITSENSGKLVSLVRSQAKAIAEDNNSNCLIVDGPPGIGCPVIASLTGADAVLLVAEPTQSGIHDLYRIIHLIQHFNIPVFICINKWDINPRNSAQIRLMAKQNKAHYLGVIPYDETFTQAQIANKTIIEKNPISPASLKIKSIWKKMGGLLN